MAARHRSREHALQILFQWDMRKQPVEESIAAFYGSLYSEESAVRPERDEFLEQLVRGTVEKAGEIDALISGHAEHWRIERMPAVDRNILRLAIYELRNTETPPAVAIDEALELARRFSTEESVQFVNGVLDAVNKEGSRC
ncbi:MAG TPA: transcription antitermination factor NusB [Bryobacteraceae bacterium]|nr:transcription antitermination factor NusB [Bryobacteraceae bacterium]